MLYTKVSTEYTLHPDAQQPSGWPLVNACGVCHSCDASWTNVTFARCTMLSIARMSDLQTPLHCVSLLITVGLLCVQQEDEGDEMVHPSQPTRLSK